jgi:hypothetical protein
MLEEAPPAALDPTNVTEDHPSPDRPSVVHVRLRPGPLLSVDDPDIVDW